MIKILVPSPAPHGFNRCSPDDPPIPMRGKKIKITTTKKKLRENYSHFAKQKAKFCYNDILSIFT